MHNIHSRNARIIISELSYVLSAVPKGVMSNVARGLAIRFNLPPKVMLKAMRRYVRLYR